jgi:hypothetical protein
MVYYKPQVLIKKIKIQCSRLTIAHHAGEFGCGSFWDSFLLMKVSWRGRNIHRLYPSVREFSIKSS